ncbi:hypothetical protein J3E74DRAFT_296553 [Bipolaris maydis]|nr:hypothetical protein J3E74DRAFT_296553 [Bipolaris maydis]
MAAFVIWSALALALARAGQGQGSPRPACASEPTGLFWHLHLHPHLHRHCAGPVHGGLRDAPVVRMHMRAVSHGTADGGNGRHRGRQCQPALRLDTALRWGAVADTLAMGVSGEALWTAGPLGTNRSSSGTRGFDKSRLSRPRRPVWSARIGVRVDHGDGIPCSPRASTCAFASSRIQQAPPAVPALRSHWAVFTKHTGTARLHATPLPHPLAQA